ncbi:MAG: prepilin-type N-terminal cleavage/methylation domain-containing protein [Rhodocyclaceae bacterium]|nr:MAG: prepilin-type N-terminal cleavage/methylation domain-containing protein [Rhodocyclaceae bacterium]
MKIRILNRAAWRSGRGFTIIELMIAMTIGLVLVGAVSVVLLGAMKTSTSRERDSESQANGRYAIDTLRRSLNHAGFLGISSLFWPDDPYLGAAVPSGSSVAFCDTAFIGKLSRRVWASSGTNPYSTTCIPTANYLAGTDVLVVRNLSLNPVAGPYTTAAPVAANFIAPATGFVAGTIYFHEAYEGGQSFLGNAVPDMLASSKQPPYYDYRLEEYVYYISPWTNSATESPQIPALYRMRLDAGPAMVSELIASGVENIQVRAGQMSLNTTGTYFEPGSVTDWDSVQAIEVALLVRSTTIEPGLAGVTRTHRLAGNTVTVTDGYPREVYSAVVQLRN